MSPPSPEFCKKTTRRQPDIHLPRNKQTAPSNTNNKHHLATVIVSPARDRAAARQRTRMGLQTKRHNPLTPSSQTTNQLTRKLKSPNHNNTTDTIPKDCCHMPPTQKPRGNHNPELTPPKASIATPLPKPTTATGVNRSVVVSSPSCTKKHVVSPTYISPATNKQLPQTQTTSITWPQ